MGSAPFHIDDRRGFHRLPPFRFAAATTPSLLSRGLGNRTHDRPAGWRLDGTPSANAVLPLADDVRRVDVPHAHSRRVGVTARRVLEGTIQAAPTLRRFRYLNGCALTRRRRHALACSHRTRFDRTLRSRTIAP